MCIQHEDLRRLEDLLGDIIDSVNMMLSLLPVIDKHDGLAKNVMVRVVKTLVGDTVVKVMEQEHQLERVLETGEPEAYVEWLMSVSPQYKVFQVRKEQAQPRNSWMAAAGL